MSHSFDLSIETAKKGESVGEFIQKTGAHNITVSMVLQENDDRPDSHAVSAILINDDGDNVISFNTKSRKGRPVAGSGMVAEIAQMQLAIDGEDIHDVDDVETTTFGREVTLSGFQLSSPLDLVVVCSRQIYGDAKYSTTVVGIFAADTLLAYGEEAGKGQHPRYDQAMENAVEQEYSALARFKAIAMLEGGGETITDVGGSSSAMDSFGEAKDV